MRSSTPLIERAQQVELAAAATSALAPLRLMSATGLSPRLKDRALIRRRQEAAVEAIEPAGRNHAAVEDDEAGQVLALAAQAVGDPRAHAGPALQAAAGVHEVIGVGVLREVRRPSSGRSPGRRRTWPTCGNRSLTGMPLWPYWRNFHGRLEHVADVVELRGLDLHLDRLAVLAVEPRLGIERIDLRRPAVHEQEDDVLGLGRESAGPAGRSGLSR